MFSAIETVVGGTGLGIAGSLVARMPENAPLVTLPELALMSVSVVALTFGVLLPRDLIKTEQDLRNQVKIGRGFVLDQERPREQGVSERAQRKIDHLIAKSQPAALAA